MRIWRSFRPLLTPKTRRLMTFTPRIDSVIHTFSSNIFVIADKIPQGYPRRRTAHTFPFSRSLETGHRNSLHATYHALTRVFRGLSFLCVVFGFQWLGRVCFVLLVLALDVLGSLRRSFSMILVAPPYLFLCIYIMPKRHMWGVFEISSIGFY